MKFKHLNLLILMVLIIQGCSANKTRPNNFVSAIDKKRIMGRVSTTMIHMYLKAHGCKKSSFDRKIIGPILDSKYDDSDILSEHWLVKACDTKFNLRMDFNLNEDRVETAQYEP